MDSKKTDQGDKAQVFEGAAEPHAQEVLQQLQEKYDSLSQQVDDMMMQAMERANRITTEAEVSHLIMNQVFNASYDGIWAVDKSFKVIKVNKKLLELLGKPAQEVIGHKCRDLFPTVCQEGESCPMQKILRGESMVERDLTVTFASGKTIPCMITATPLRGLEGNTIGVVETVKDITERKHAEEIMQRAHEELERLATQDGLTQLANRRRFDEYLNTEWRRQMREQNPIALVLCDVDFFKRFNDTYGHQAGDDCLRAVGAALRQSIHRAADLGARYGGEEFVAVLPATDAEGARHVAESICQKVAEIKIPHSQSTAAPHVTISCGVSCLIPSETVTPKLLIEQADQALYRAKQQGRNRVVCHEADSPSQ